MFGFVFVEATVTTLVSQVLPKKCFRIMTLYNPQHMTDLKSRLSSLDL